MLKKINAILAFITSLLALAHVVSMGLVMTGLAEINPLFITAGSILLRVFTLHTALALIIIFFNKGDGFKYVALNKSTLVQRAASLLLLLFIHFHMNHYFVDGAVVVPGVFAFVTEILFIIVYDMHFMPSVDKGLTTLGINSKAVTAIIRVVTLMTVLFALVSVCIYYIGALA